MKNNKLKENKKTRKLLDLGFEDPDFHSRAYHRYFEGYSEFKKVDENGKTHIDRVYTGIWYVPDLSRSQRILRKFIYLVVWILSAALLGFCATRGIGVNTTWYCVAAQVITIIGLIWSAMGLLNYLIAPNRQTVFEWRSSSEKLKRGTLAATVAFLLSTVVNCVYLFSHVDALAMQVLCIVGYLLGAALMILMNRLERGVSYIKTPSQNTVLVDTDPTD